MAYWYLEANYDLKTALIGGVVLGVLELMAEKLITKKTHAISKLNFGLIVFLGSLALLGEDGIWFKLQPFFSGVIVGSIFVYKTSQGKGLMLQTMNDLGDESLPPKVMNRLERDMGFFTIAYAFVMGIVAFTCTTDTWLLFKTVVFYVTSFIFILFEFFFVLRKASS